MRRILFALACAALLAVAGCAASYPTRMKHLDDVTNKGLAYRTQLQKQGTDPTKKACEIGWTLLQDDPPDDGVAGIQTEQWTAQVREAYVKACMTGGHRPKPDPSGIDAVTPVPFTSQPAQ